MDINPRATLFTLSVATGVAMTGLGIIWPLLPVLATDMGAGGLLLGFIIASFNVARTLFSPVVGRYSDAMGRKYFIVLGLAAYAVISCAYVLASSPEALLGVRFVHGFASLLIAPIAMALTADIAPKEKLGSYLGVLNMAFLVGLGVGPSLGGVIQGRLGMDAAFYSMGLLALLTCVLVLVQLPADKDSGAVTRKSGVASLGEILSHRTALAIILMRFFVACGQGAVYTFLPIYALHVGMPSAQVGIILSANIFFIALMQQPIGRLADRVNPKPIVICGMYLSAAAVLGMPMVEGFLMILGLNILMGLSNGLIFPGSAVITGRLGRSMGMASMMSVIEAAWSLGMIISPIMSGLIFDIWGVDYVFTVGSVFIGVGSVVVTVLLSGASSGEPE